MVMRQAGVSDDPNLSAAGCDAADASATSRTLGRRLAAVAGAAGAAALGAGEAQAAGITYVPTAGVAAAQGIPGFSFVSASNVTLGALRPPATGPASTTWDVDGGTGDAFKLRNWYDTQAFFDGDSGAALAFYEPPEEQKQLLNLAEGAAVGNALNFSSGVFGMTIFGNDVQPQFTTNVSGQFGFRFLDGSSTTLYGWGSLVIDEFAQGEGFKITEAYYQTNGGPINVGAVPVPEPSSMALLGIGAAGVAAWRARRKSRAEA